MALKLDAARLDAALTPALQGFIAREAYAGFSATVWQGERLVYQRLFGQQDREAATPWREDAIVRIYSMSKPITGAAMAVLWDRGLWDIDDPVAKYLPEFGETRVYVSGGPGDYVSAPQATPMTLRHLFTHTSGLSYGWSEHPVDAAYRSSLWPPITRAAGTRAWPSLWPSWPSSRSCSSRARRSTIPSPPTCWGGWPR